MERMRILAIDWAENGFGSPKMIHTIYIAKLLVLFVIGGITVATATSGLPAFWHVTEWWNQPIVYQKIIVWTVLLEAIGVAGSWGPLTGRRANGTGGILFWARPGTIRLRPWEWVPFTNGDRRTRLDIGLYLALLVSLAIPLCRRACTAIRSRKHCRTTYRLDQSGPAGRANCAAGAERAARQDDLPGRPLD